MNAGLTPREKRMPRRSRRQKEEKGRSSVKREKLEKTEIKEGRFNLTREIVWVRHCEQMETRQLTGNQAKEERPAGTGESRKDKGKPGKTNKARDRRYSSWQERTNTAEGEMVRGRERKWGVAPFGLFRGNRKRHRLL